MDPYGIVFYQDKLIIADQNYTGLLLLNATGESGSTSDVYAASEVAEGTFGNVTDVIIFEPDGKTKNFVFIYLKYS